MARNISVFGIYPSQAAVEEAVASLRAAGFRHTDVSVLFPENVGSKDLGHEKHTKAPEGATTGAASGAIVGGTLGWLAGIGALAIPGIGPFIAAGPIIGMLAGMGAGGAAGGMLGGLIGLGIPEYEAKRYEGRIRKGGILLSVHSDNSDWGKKAQTILEQTGAEDISSTSESRADFAESDKPIPRHATTAAESVDRVRTSGGVDVTRMTDLRVRDVMSTGVEYIDADRPISDAADKMRAANVGFLPVREGGLIVGVVTDRDITVRGTAPGYDPRVTPVRTVMTSEYSSCLESDGISEVLRTMEDKQVKRMLVLDGQKRLVGVISMGDISNRFRTEPAYG